MNQKDILPGKEVTFSVQTTGTLPLSYQWQWKVFGKKDEQSKWQNLFSEERMSRKVTSELKLARVQAHNAGYYRCLVSNCAGSTSSNTARLTIGKHTHN